MHKFPKDFYGSELSVCVCGYIRPELKFNSLGRFFCMSIKQLYLCVVFILILYGIVASLVS